MKYFNNFPYTVESLKAEFRALCLTMHPDKGGNADEFKAMSAEYYDLLKNVDGTTAREAEEARQRAEEARREREEREREAREYEARERARREQEEAEERERIRKAQEVTAAAGRDEEADTLTAARDIYNARREAKNEAWRKKYAAQQYYYNSPKPKKFDELTELERAEFMMQTAQECAKDHPELDLADILENAEKRLEKAKAERQERYNARCYQGASPR